MNGKKDLTDLALLRKIGLLRNKKDPLTDQVLEQSGISEAERSSLFVLAKKYKDTPYDYFMFYGYPIETDPKTKRQITRPGEWSFIWNIYDKLVADLEANQKSDTFTKVTTIALIVATSVGLEITHLVINNWSSIVNYFSEVWDGLKVALH